jgi:hypothetical protein
MDLYAVFKTSVYRHECAGIFTTIEKAKDAAIKCLRGERDEHHYYEISSFVLDEITPQSPVPEKRLIGGELIENDPILRFKMINGAIKMEDDQC